MIGPIGYGMLVISLVTSLLGVVASIYGGRTRSSAMLETARRAALVTFPLLTASVVALLILLVAGHFEYAYVYQTTDLAMPFYLKLTALWGGQEGSLLFWCWLLSGFSFITLVRKWKTEKDLLPWVITVTSFTVFFFLALVLFFENPFNRYFITMDGQVVSSLFPPIMSLQANPPDGAGLNPSCGISGWSFTRQHSTLDSPASSFLTPTLSLRSSPVAAMTTGLSPRVNGR